MMDWTDRHCRVFHRAISSKAFLYTEMVTTGALIHGDVERHLGFDPLDHPVALQLGGSEPGDLAACARLAQRYGYAEVNLNCGCPSERVQRGAFGACLMETPEQVADCVKAMRDAVSIPVTVKHRIGLGRHEGYDFVRDFIGTVAAAGCDLFIVHARNAWLDGLSPKENREVPPLRYDIVHRLKAEFPDLTIILNGGLTTHEGASASAQGLDGVMFGREAYHNPWVLGEVDSHWYGVADLSDHPPAGSPVVSPVGSPVGCPRGPRLVREQPVVFRVLQCDDGITDDSVRHDNRRSGERVHSARHHYVDLTGQRGAVLDGRHHQASRRQHG